MPKSEKTPFGAVLPIPATPRQLKLFDEAGLPLRPKAKFGTVFGLSREHLHLIKWKLRLDHEPDCDEVEMFVQQAIKMSLKLLEQAYLAVAEADKVGDGSENASSDEIYAA